MRILDVEGDKSLSEIALYLTRPEAKEHGVARFPSTRVPSEPGWLALLN